MVNSVYSFVWYRTRIGIYCRDALKLLSTKKQTFQGLAQDGVYVYSPVANMNK